METRKASAGTILCFSHKYYFSLYFIDYNDITWRSRIMFSRALLEKRGNIALRRAKGPLPLPRPSLALKLPLVLYAGGGSRICKCVLCVQRQHSGKETKYEGGREANGKEIVIIVEINCVD